MEFELLKAIREKGLKQRDFAKIVGEHESVVSRIITGSWEIDPLRKFKWSRALGKKPEDLFPERE